jgi:proteasome lid subunit RPN8/RPN11
MHARISGAHLMRWTDVPDHSAKRSVAAWLADRQAQQIADPRVLVAIATVATAVPPDAGPVVALHAAAIASASQHVGASRLERGGLLLGEAFGGDGTDRRIVLVEVRAAIPSREDDATALSLRMHAGVWDTARAAMRPGERVVGWYHSHPGIGAFYSATDRRTQAGFFREPWSLAWVIDPQRNEQAWFAGPRSQVLPIEAIMPIDVRIDGIPFTQTQGRTP